jgi:hypothetical protein
VTDVLAAHACGISSADQCTDRCAGDRGRLQPHVVERLKHRNVGEAARAATTERERERFHAPACTAKSQAFAAKAGTSAPLAAAKALVAVPSRTRPAMPCKIAAMRKKL